jgi:hypothetical protein
MVLALQVRIDVEATDVHGSTILTGSTTAGFGAMLELARRQRPGTR